MTEHSPNTFDLGPLEDRAAQLVEAAAKAGADAADAIVASSRSSGVDVRQGEVEEIESSENDAFTLRVFVGQRSASVSANRGGDATELAARAVAMAHAAPENPYAGLAIDSDLATSFPELDLFDTTVWSMDEMQHRALECEAAALAVKGVSKSSGASCSTGLGGTVLATSTGFLGSYAASRFSLSVSAVAGDGDGMERDYDFDSQRHCADLKSATTIGQRAGERAAKRIGPMRVDTQKATIVFEPRMARSLVGHLAGALNGSSIVRQTSFLRDEMGNQVCNPAITLIDEPHLKRGQSSRPFDAEGVALQDLDLVRDGVIANWTLDSGTARELGLKTNGRANRAGSGTSPGTTNLTLLAGETSPEEIIAGLNNGFYVTELIGQGVNLVTGDYSRGASGFWIENGELTYAVSEVTIAGNLRDMFANMVPASDLEKRNGVNAPTIAIEGLTIAGG